MNSYNDDYHITPDQLFKKPKLAENQPSATMKALCEKKDQGGPVKAENRLSFDFCELNADQLLESTPHSYKVDYKTHKKERRHFAFNK